MGEGTRSLKGQSRDLPITPAEATDDRPDEPEIQEAAPRASRLSTTFQKLTDRLRVRTQSQKNTSVDLPTSPSASTDSANRGTSTSRISESYQKLVDRLREQTRRIKAARQADPAVSPDVTTTEPEIQEAASPGPLSQPESAIEIPAVEDPLSPSTAIPIPERSESTVSPVDDSREIVPSTFRKLTDRLGVGTRSLKGQSRDLPTTPAEATDDRPGESEIQEAASRASKLSTTFQKLTDRLRVRTQSQKNTSVDLPTSPSASTDSANRGTSTSRISESYQKLVDRLREQTRRIKAARQADPAVSPDVTTTEPEIQEASPPATKFSGTYRTLIESLRGSIRRSGDKSQSTPVQEDSPDDQEMAPSRSSKLSGTYKTLVERLREGRKRFQNRSVPVSEDSPGRGTMGLPAVAEPPSRPIWPSSRQRLVHSIWKSKQAGEVPTEVTAPPPKPRIPQSTFSDDDTASPGSEDDEFQLPR